MDNLYLHMSMGLLECGYGLLQKTLGLPMVMPRPFRFSLKSAYQNGHISAATQASQHLDALLMSLDEADENGGD